MKREQILRGVGHFLNGLALVAPARAGRLALHLFTRPRRRVSGRPDVEALLDQAHPAPLTVQGILLQGYHWASDQPQTSTKRILLLHGYESQSGRWATLVRLLLKNGFHVYAFDAPASGRSSGRELTLTDYIDAALIFDGLHGPFYGVVGHSMGGGVAIQLCTRLPPERRPHKACILASYDEVEHVLDWYQRATGFNERVRRNFNAAIVRRVGQPVSDFSSVTAVRQLADVRGLLLHSRNDQRVNFRESERLLAAWPGARLELFDELGHGLRSPLVDQQVVQFLLE